MHVCVCVCVHANRGSRPRVTNERLKKSCRKHRNKMTSLWEKHVSPLAQKESEVKHTHTHTHRCGPHTVTHFPPFNLFPFFLSTLSLSSGPFLPLLPRSFHPLYVFASYIFRHLLSGSSESLSFLCAAAMLRALLGADTLQQKSYFHRCHSD